ncbi:hypothetical protein [Pseudomonas fluorescens]|uniref:hypothetical protein n=1 Tax=Pseudomonas fluorescens TaxID=294 RepID=UPI00177E4C54|nr:hypothetical protein [Pseudomonas fluorescens]
MRAPRPPYTGRLLSWGRGYCWARRWKSVQRTITVWPSFESGGMVLKGRWLQLR